MEILTDAHDGLTDWLALYGVNNLFAYIDLSAENTLQSLLPGALSKLSSSSSICEEELQVCSSFTAYSSFADNEFLYVCISVVYFLK